MIGDVILAELRRVLTTKFKVPADRMESIEAVFAPFPPIPKRAAPGLASIRDPADRWVFATTVAERADVLVTGDQDLLAVRDGSPLLVLEPRAFWELLRASPG